MGSNWAEEFRRRIEESEGKYRPADNHDGMDDEEWEEKEEEDAEIEEPEDEVEQEDEDEEEAEEVEQEVRNPEIEKPLPVPVETPRLSLERQRFRQELDNLFGSTTIQPAKTEVTKAEPAKPVKRETNDLAVAGAAMVGLMVLSLMPTFYQAMMQAFQPIMQGFQSLGGRGYGTPTATQEWVACPYCGYQCLGYNDMPCPCCGRS
jgi:hypothetical protein